MALRFSFEISRIEREQAGEPPLAVGIGLNYGAAVIGDVGSEQSLAFSVIGDCEPSWRATTSRFSGRMLRADSGQFAA